MNGYLISREYFELVAIRRFPINDVTKMSVILEISLWNINHSSTYGTFFKSNCSFLLLQLWFI